MQQRRLAALVALCTADALLAACSLLPGPAAHQHRLSSALGSTSAAAGLTRTGAPAGRRAAAAGRRLLQSETARGRCVDGPESEAEKAECTTW